MSEPSPETIFFAALERPPGERAAYLDGACGGDAALRAHIEKMLAAQPDLGEFLDRAHPVPAEALRAGRAFQPPADHAGAVIAGKYKLLQLIGEGGMGSVWMADQLHPVRRRVAVKLVRGEHGSSRDILARFEAERQAIALMDHPHVAKLLDAGTTGQSEESSLGAGRPYFVMELVKGVPLNEYCDQHQLTVPDRLHLFTQICSAVQHAHQKGVIHRDLKPGNILVESHDGKPVPKVIDFGMAKAIGGMQLTENTLFTRLGTVAGTPQYMAPEQATFNALDVDTRADVYALGVVLYELLTGTTPIEREQLKRSSLDEIFRVIRESEPPTPSKRLSSTDAKPAVAAKRRTEPLKLGRFLRGDLDWIVMKALAKERDRRYQSANGFAEDVERFLNHEPVLAGPPSAAYRLRKFVRRNRPQVIAGGLLLAVLLAGIGGTTFGMIHAVRARADEAEQRALAEANEAKAVAAARAEKEAKVGEAGQRRKAEKARDRTWEAFEAMTSSVTGDSLTTQKAISDEQKKFLTGVLTYYQEFAGEKADDEQSQFRTASAAFRVGLIEYRLGRRVEAAAAFGLARDRFAKLAAEFPAVPAYRQELAVSHHHLGALLKELGKWPQAEEQVRKALGIKEKLAADFPAVPAYRQDLAFSHNTLGTLLRDLGKWPQAEEQHLQALGIQEKLAADFPAVPGYRQELAYSHICQGNLLRDLGEWPQAQEQYRKALVIREKLEADFPAVPAYRQDLAASHNNLGTLLNALRKGPQAEEQLRKALVILEKLAADFPAVPAYRQNLAASHNNLGTLLNALRKGPQAEEQLRKALVIREKLAADFPGMLRYQIDLGGSYCNLGSLFSDGGQPGASLVWFEKAIRTLTPVYEQNRRLEEAKQFLRNSHVGRAHTYSRLEKFAEAVEDWDKVIELSPKAERAEELIKLGGSYCNLGHALRASGRLRESLVSYERAIRTLTGVRKQDRGSALCKQFLRNSYWGRARAYHGLQKFTEAVKDWDQAIDLSRVAEQAWLRARRASSQVKAGRVAEAVAEAAELTKSTNWDGRQWYAFACIYAIASGKSAEKKSEHADQAMELLQRAVNAGYKDASHVARDQDLDPLRGRDDFKKLLAELAKK
jgi:eukaryotic-like serine/threonine-protein kinase